MLLAVIVALGAYHVVRIYANINIGNSKPRVFATIPETTTKANTGAKRGPKKATATKASKPVGVTKKPAAAKKTSVAAKVRHLCDIVQRDKLTLYRQRDLSRRPRELLLQTPKRRYVLVLFCYDSLTRLLSLLRYSFTTCISMLHNTSLITKLD